MPPYKYMVKYIKQKQQQKQQLQSLLPPELATLDTPLGGVLIIKGGGTFIKGPRVLRSLKTYRLVVLTARSEVDS